MTVTVIVEVNDQRLRAVMDELQRRCVDLKPLHDDFGKDYLDWTDLNFRRGGSPPWKPIKRQGQPLRDTGRMANSFTYEATATEMRGGTNDQKAPWHHFGTRGPYPIAAKHKKALAFAWPSNPGAGNFVKSSSGFKRVAAVTIQGRKGQYRTKGGGLTKGSQNLMMVVRKVMHPGLPARPLLPTAQQILTEMKVVRLTEIYLENAMKRGG